MCACASSNVHVCIKQWLCALACASSNVHSCFCSPEEIQSIISGKLALRYTGRQVGVSVRGSRRVRFARRWWERGRV